MTLQTSGPISLGNVREELEAAGPISLASSAVRELAGVSDGPISMSGLYGKSYEIREPETGEHYINSTLAYYCFHNSDLNHSFFFWNTLFYSSGIANGIGDLPFIDFEGWRYFRGTARPTPTGATADFYGIYRIQL
ncbi:hypothetical protein [Pseudovibrio sp. Tun.PSC04-5.I4]|uniref:hypothetical protein n=1 Tax=Pseudovibrio sp. Tun.PSC04-5.I4 TaxID=1798213 RepID=UPI00088044E6|nr:hypothetical protein [Pseudovibrio sp. Tun.PSC04-5.I4]SDQ99891.1 hypothetical protein SAMN04515695_2243 [Pseudovibrio sp. Tun.PSC04-5.I4]